MIVIVTVMSAVLLLFSFMRSRRTIDIITTATATTENPPLLHLSLCLAEPAKKIKFNHLVTLGKTFCVYLERVAGIRNELAVFHD